MRAVENISSTSRPNITLCFYKVRVENWLNGVGGAQSVEGATYAELHRIWPVSYWGSYTVYSKHWQIWFASVPNVWEYYGTKRSDVTITAPTSPESLCKEMGGEWINGTCRLGNTPIIADTARNGYRLTSVDDGVRFDLDADGNAELLAWTEPDSDDCFLAMDRNGNGTIDDGRELFGNATPAYADSAEPPAAQGFAALAFLEGPAYGPSVSDRRIDSRDAPFSRLLLWCDANHNGVSESSELTSAAAAGLLSLSTDAKESGRRDAHGNLFRLKARAVWTTGEHYLHDVWLVSRP
jgi:hypothetical protein